MLISSALTFFFKYLMYKQDVQRDRDEMMLKTGTAQADTTHQARTYDNKGFQYTRRFIAIALTLCVIVIPMVWPVIAATLIPNMIDAEKAIGITFGYTEIKSGFWPFSSDSTETIWREFGTNIVITPWHADMFAAVIGMYFGDRFSQRR